jgi:tetratricopeptide (TPR) repeat protein
MGININRSDLHQAINAGVQTGEYQFANDLIDQWMNKYPQDIEAEIQKARLLIKSGSKDTGREILTRVVAKDPENIDCIRLIHKVDITDKKYFSSALYLLTGRAEEIREIYPWATTIRALKNEIKKNNYSNAEKLLSNAISESPNNIYLALEHIKLFVKNKDLITTRHILEIYEKRWPECLQIKLFLALNLLESHQESDSVAILHSCSRADPGGIVAKRYFGPSHEFLSIFPENQVIDFQGVVPTSIALTFKWSQLPSGKRSQSKTYKTEKRSNSSSHTVNTYPNTGERSSTEKVYVILTSYSGLLNKYGPKSTEVILDLLNRLSSSLEKNPRWKPIIFIPDNADSVADYGLSPISAIDPWKIKLALMDLSAIIDKSNLSIGAVLIVGNHDVVPFHRLPNPTEDSDEYVLSDNPYCTTSSNYLLPEWIVGRLIGESSKDPGLLIEQIRHITEFHNVKHHSQGLVHKILQTIKRLKNFGRFIRETLAPPNDYGYSAEVWRRSSIAAFRPIGKGSDLRVSPPYDTETIDTERLLQAKCVYFNLHGLATTNEWYGQRDFGENPAGPDFPVAISADKIANIANNIDLAFTEACYGGYVLDKKIDESIAIKLLAIGSQGVVGSSSIAYGSVFTPLIGADLLAFIFWKYIKDGYSFGNALRQSKIGLIKVMMQRQGYLDGEDQKTLLSFNLFGDPLGCLEEIVFLGRENDNGIKESELTLVNDTDGILGSQSFTQHSLSNDVREVLDSYIHGLETAKMRVRKQKIQLGKILTGDSGQQMGTNLELKNITQIVYEKTISVNKREHLQFARVTVDESGKVIKLAISR